jgi:hypothetical protein
MTHLRFHQNTKLGVFQTGCSPDVRFWHKADNPIVAEFDRFWITADILNFRLRRFVS